MNLAQLNKVAGVLSEKYWGLEFNIMVVENGRLQRSLGRAMFTVNRMTGKVTPKRIELSKNLLTNYPDEIIVDVLKHELCHWALAVQGKPYNDGHPVFENELKRIGSHSTHTISVAGNLYTVECSKCGDTVAKNHSKRRLNKYVDGTSRREYSTRCCGAKIVWGESIHEVATNTVSASTMQETMELLGSTSRIATPAPIPTAPVILVQQQTPVQTVGLLEKVSLEEILIPGPRGVTNKQMIPAITKALDLNKPELINELRKQYPEVFQGSCKYLNKTYKSKYETLMG